MHASPTSPTGRRSQASPRAFSGVAAGFACGLALLLSSSCAKNGSYYDGVPTANVPTLALARPDTAPATVGSIPVPARAERADRLPVADVDRRIDAAFAGHDNPKGERLAREGAIREGATSSGADDKQFRPVLARLLKPDAFASPGRLKEPERKQARPSFGDAPLAGFHAKLAALESGRRSEPVTILHIGDSHIASDRFTRGIRSRLQARFGDAGRGAVIPAGVFPYADADQVEMSKTGPWSAATSLKEKSGPYGVSGVRLAASSPAATIALKAKKDSFDWAEVTVAAGAGSFDVSVDGRTQRFRPTPGKAATTVRIDRRGTELKVRPAGDGRVTVLNWATGKNRPGIRYVNFGIVGATVDVTRRWDPEIVANDLKALKPDLIVYGYGTNEGFNGNLDQQAYKAYAQRFVDGLRRNAPDADIVFIGAADGARKGSGQGCGGAWATPAKLDSVREAVSAIADAGGHGYWNWGEAMGGRCGISSWVSKGLAAKDHVHLTSSGYDRSAAAFYDYLVKPLGSADAVAFNR